MQLYDPKTGSWYEVDPNAQTASVTSDENGPSTSYSPGVNITANGAPPLGVPKLLSPTGSAQGMASEILSAEFADWQNTYKPVELNLLNQSSLNNPRVLTDAVNRAGSMAGQTADTMQGVGQRAMAARGIAPTAQQQMVDTRLSGLSKAASIAGAQNRARQSVATQDELIALGSAPNPNLIGGSLSQQGG